MMFRRNLLKSLAALAAFPPAKVAEARPPAEAETQPPTWTLTHAGYRFRVYDHSPTDAELGAGAAWEDSASGMFLVIDDLILTR